MNQLSLPVIPHEMDGNPIHQRGADGADIRAYRSARICRARCRRV